MQTLPMLDEFLVFFFWLLLLLLMLLYIFNPCFFILSFFPSRFQFVRVDENFTHKSAAGRWTTTMMMFVVKACTIRL